MTPDIDEMTGDSILAAEEELRQAMMENDVAALDRLIDDDLIFTGFDGAFVTKSMDLEAHRLRLLRATRIEPSERVIRRYGEVAVVIVRMDFEGTYAGESTNGAMRYTRIWRNTPAGWRIVAGHMGRIE